VENRVFLSRGVYVTGAIWWAATRIMAGVGHLVQRTRDGQAHVRYSVAGRLGGRVTSCVVCTVHMKTGSTNFLVEPQPTLMVCQYFGLKTTGTASPDLPSKPVARVS
jgi:hypothetical protein